MHVSGESEGACSDEGEDVCTDEGEGKAAQRVNTLVVD